MKISLNWISDFVDLQDVNVEDLVSRFTLSVAETENIEYMGKNISDVVCGHIVDIANHPDSKKLHLLRVDDGKDIVDVVCGAPNARKGLKTAFARIGANVNGLSIAAAKVAGYDSFGMCCSAKELGISDDNGGIMELSDDTVTGTCIKKIFDIEDVLVEVDNKSLTHRPDLWGHYGIAREIAAVLNRPLKSIDIFDYSESDFSGDIDIKIEDKEKCYRYTAGKISNITRNISPVNMQIRLFYCGMRAINFVTDLTNYVMLELGQPMHAFNANSISNIKVKTFIEPFEFLTLDNEKRKIDSDTLMICSEDKPCAIAGIMGGHESETGDDTSAILIESANFAAVPIRKTSSRLALRTQASARYEKSLDPELTLTALLRYVFLLKQYDNNAKLSFVKDVYMHHFEKVVLSIDKNYIDRYTGIDIPLEQIIGILSSLEFEVKCEDKQLLVTVPSFRATKDVTIKADLVEEISRIYGYDNFEINNSVATLSAVKIDEARENEYKIKHVLSTAFGFNEVHSYLWYNSVANNELGIKTNDIIKLKNSSTPECSTLRDSIIPSQLNFVNTNKQYNNDFGLFEIGHVVSSLDKDGQCIEGRRLAITLASKLIDEKQIFSKLISVINTVCDITKHTLPRYEKRASDKYFSWVHSKNCANIILNEKNIGYLCVLHPVINNVIDKKLNIVICEIDYDAFSLVNSKKVTYQALSKFPSVEIDFTFVLPTKTEYKYVDEQISKFKCDALKSYKFIETYTDNSDTYSLTMKFIFQAADRTLNGEEVAGYTDELLKHLEKQDIKLKV